MGSAPRQSRAVVVRTPDEPTSVEQVLVEGPGAGEIRVELESVGVCHTDYSVARGLLPIMDYPGIPGHEGAGVVESVGPGVVGLAVGDRVMLSSIAPCGLCATCQRGDGAYCEREGARRGVMPDGTRRVRDASGAPLAIGFNSGLFADLAVVPASAAVAVPEGVPSDVAALLGCAVVSGYGAVVNAATVRPATSVLVTGCGGVGLSAVMAARLLGASPIVASDPNAERRALALDVGAMHALDPTEPGAADELRRLAGPLGYETIVEASGASSAIDAAFALLRRGGTCVYVGAPPPEEMLSVSVLALAASGKRLVGCLTGAVRPAVELLDLAHLYRDGRLPLDRLVSGHLPVERVEEALDQFDRAEGLRTILTFDR